jgi:hypothetical protein
MQFDGSIALRQTTAKRLVSSASAISSSRFLRTKKVEGSRLQIASQRHVTGWPDTFGITGRITPEYATTSGVAADDQQLM